MRIRATIVAAGVVAGLSALALAPRDAAAQASQIPPTVVTDSNWGTVSNFTMVMGASTVFAMPRVYYNDPEATIGWKARWHVSSLAPGMTITALTLLVDGPIRKAIKSTRPGCSLEDTQNAFPGSGCESYGGPSTQAFASWAATGAGVSIFLVDTFKYSDSHFHIGSFVGNVAAPLTLSILTSVGRSVNPGTDPRSQPFESVGQNVLAGGIPGLLTGAVIGFGYAWLARPNCGYGNSIICW